ncbi:TrkH family potassium uptake protein [Gordonia rhizosphera]|nr:potassium transporter TrkG [Gordonia rhizosphera]
MAAGGSGFRSPGRVIAAAFLLTIAIGAVLLSLPFATASGQRASLLDAVFTSTSAVCVTGLITVDTGSYWSTFGQVVILALIQVGGLGIMTLASLTVVLVSRQLGLRARMVAQAQVQAVTASDIGRVVRNVIIFTLGSEAVVAAILVVRLVTAYHMSVGGALYDAVFHAISAFCNAGFSLNADSLMRYVGDSTIVLAISAAVIVGGLGFPVIFELVRAWRHPRTWSVTTRITVWVTLVLLIAGTLLIALAERHNPATLGPMSTNTRLLAAFFSSMTPRTAGFNVIDTGAMTHEGLLVTDVLMFIGGGSASVAGGIKVTTVGLLAYVLWAEMRGDAHVDVGHRQIPADNQRQALAVALLGALAATTATFALLFMTDFDLDAVLFESLSALSTVGMSTGITAALPEAGKWLIIVLMYLGRLGPLTLASALALRQRERRFERPMERITVG